MTNAAIPLPTQAELQAQFDYDPHTGVFTKINKKRANREVGWTNADGYKFIRYKGRVWKQHRLAIMWMAGVDPGPLDVDHVNGDKGDNRWKNLRLGTTNMTAQNRANPPGRLPQGVGRNGKRFQAKIMYDGKQRYIGTFDTPEQAHAAYLEAKRQHHPHAIMSRHKKEKSR